MKPKTVPAVQRLLTPYGVTLQGNWSPVEAYSAYVGTHVVGQSLAPITNTGEATAYQKSFGPMTYTASNDLGGWFGTASDGQISILIGKTTPRLVVHELGHAFEKHIWAAYGGRYAGTNNPIQMLIDDGVYDRRGNLVTGHNNRNNDLPAPVNGYWSDDIPDQYHPRWLEDGDNTHEDWADIFMNWVYDSFYPNPAGEALNNWVTTNMAEWVR